MQGTLPGSARIGQATDALLSISDMHRVFSLAETIAYFSGKPEDALIAIGGFRMPTDLVLDITETIPCFGFVSRVAKPAVQD
jgi:hypothetical protein